MIWAYAISLVGGYLIALMTGAIIGIKKAKKYPGGSLACGVGVGLTYSLTSGNIAVCALLGIIDWLVYVIVFRKK